MATKFNRGVDMRWIVFCSIFFVGCDAAYVPLAEGIASNSDISEGKSGYEYSNSESDAVPAISGSAQPNGVGNTESMNSSRETTQPSASRNRRIIYTASLSLIVEEFDGLEDRMLEVVNSSKGYLSRVDLDQMQGESRQGKWTARIPVENYHSFLQLVTGLGLPVSQEQDASDVTEEFVDITARIENEKRLETRILELLTRTGDKLQQVIEVERELSRVRQSIERMEGRIRFLADQSSLTTVQITIRERKDFQPAQAPGFLPRIKTAFSDSISATLGFISDVMVALASIAIPSLIITSVTFACWLVFGKRCWRYFVNIQEPTTSQTESNPT